jgi:flagellar hook-associated protein 2
MAINPLGTSGSSINTQAIVQQLMQVERQPLLKLKQKEAAYQAKVSAYATLLSSVSSFKSAVTALKDSSLIGMKATVSDTSYMTATASSTATAGTYTMKIGSLAAAQSLSSLRFGSQTQKVADLSVNTTQKIKIQVGSGTAKEITIDSTNNTLSGIKDAINSAGAGVTASVVKQSSSFVIDANNKTIIFNDGTADRTATIAEGTYTSSELATAVQTALNTAPLTTNTFAVAYDTALSKFKITNSAGPNVNILWGSASTTAEQILGFDPTTDAVALGSSTTGDDAVDGTYRLTLTSNTTGALNTISLTVDENNDGTYGGAGETDTVGLSSIAAGNMTTTQAAADASITVSGLTVTRPSNTVTDVITGVTMNLVKISGATEFTLTVAQDSSTLTSKLNSFVSSYNQVMSTIRSLRGTMTTRGVLSGDSTSSILQNSLRTLITTTYNNTTLASLGLTHDKNGVLSLNTSTLDSAISSGSANVVKTINTMATSLESSLNNYVNTIIPARQDGYKETVKNVQKNAENLERRLQTTEVALKKRFIALDRLLNQLQGTSSYLTQQMDMLSRTFGRKK